MELRILVGCVEDAHRVLQAILESGDIRIDSVTLLSERQNEKPPLPPSLQPPVKPTPLMTPW